MGNGSLRIEVFNDPLYMENGLVISRGTGRACWIVDPGLPPQAEEIRAYLARERLNPVAVVLTHAHGDHIAGVDDVRAGFDELPLHLAEAEWAFLSDPMENLSGHFGVGVTVQADHLLDLAHGDALELDGLTGGVLDTSGHSPGGRTLYCDAEKVALVGDAIFAGSVGRMDFAHSDGDRLLANIRANILTLPDDTRLIPGHGPATTVGQEKAHNPYVR